jgi:hypothetical protein
MSPLARLKLQLIVIAEGAGKTRATSQIPNFIPIAVADEIAALETEAQDKLAEAGGASWWCNSFPRLRNPDLVGEFFKIDIDLDQ